MKILLTNDDGIDAKGIKTLEKVLTSAHDVYVIAPDSQKSGSSNAFTVWDSMILKKIDEKHFSLSGYPTDCVNVGLKAGIIPNVDCVVSGINHGPNLGDDIFFSGTVGAARMAYVTGKTGFAISLNSIEADSPHFEDAAKFLLSFIESVPINNELKLLNINYPNIPLKDTAGKCCVKLAKRHYIDSFKYKTLDDGQIVLKLDTFPPVNREPNTDAAFIDQGYITITPLTTDCCQYDSFEQYHKILENI